MVKYKEGNMDNISPSAGGRTPQRDELTYT